MNANQVTAAILDGELDDNFDAVYTAIRRRQQALAAENTHRFHTGQVVIFNGEGTRYLRGIKGIVSKVNHKTVSVHVEDNPHARRFSGLRDLRCDPTIIDPAPATAEGTPTPTVAVAPAPSVSVEQPLFTIGETVMFNSTGRRYLAGVKATVRRVNSKSVSVDVEDNPQARDYSGAKGVRCGLSIIDKLPAAAQEA